ncbi:MAG: ArsR family transcriptional regulator [Chloroflexi bacterium]|nr:MAG: ArsR family transcriptional regulator [Chloroflexota bacterium]MBL1192918.1 ArsR family transcriptional regulator [Chloroflexota bacterium]NOH10211.1 winged helix-turn-helix transcriptional regulator [Chloroflexota bacterium]
MSDDSSNSPIEISFEVGSAYDFFASLHVLHNPGEFGLRGAWAAGVRSRLSQEQRDLLEEAFKHIFMPRDWIMALPEPKDADAVLAALGQIPAEKRVLELVVGSEMEEGAEFIQKVADKGSWTPADRDEVMEGFKKYGEKITNKKIESMLDFWIKAPSLGEPLLEALQAYQEVFFAQEEKRILPRLEEAVRQARARSQELTPKELLSELSRGLTFEKLEGVEELVLIPSFWITPLIVEGKLTKKKRSLMFGARRTEDSLVPGEVVPDQILLTLKALADPTRLRILRYLAQETLTPAELARRLRLRAPTVTHHLHALRLAELVSFSAKNKQERLYAARMDALNATYAALNRFLESAPLDESQNPAGEEVFERGQVW